jgi:hypothetical protein
LGSNRVGLGGAESAPFTWGTASREPFFARQLPEVFEAFLPKRALRRVLRVRQRTPKRFSLTFTKQALKAVVNEIGPLPRWLLSSIAP